MVNPKNNTLFHIPIADLSMDETLSLVAQTIASGKSMHHSVVNAGKIVAMQENAQLRESVLAADLINADGFGVLLAGKLLGKPFKERVTGIDLMQALMQLAHEKQYKLYFLGAREEVLRKVVDKYAALYSPAIIGGYHHGYFTEEEEATIVQEIVASQAQILFVAMSSPLKEQFLYRHKEALAKVNFIMGVGGSFDVVAGLVKRAPLWMQHSGLEWFYRVLQEPKRMFKRYLVGNTQFLLLLLRELSRRS